jgi:hypothetical protein
MSKTQRAGVTLSVLWFVFWLVYVTAITGDDIQATVSNPDFWFVSLGGIFLFWITAFTASWNYRWIMRGKS